MIFVAGTGRSGTSRIADVLGEHPMVYRIPMETRFIVDPGGLRDLADALTVRYDPIIGEDALSRLRELLTVRIPARRDDRGKTVPELVGESRYRDVVDRLWPSLTACAYGSRVVPRYFENRPELISILRRTVDALFRHDSKPIWCEKTPFNLLAMDFLWEMFPEAAIVHVKRHPVAVVASHVDQQWAPSTVAGALTWVKPVLRRWLAWKSTADLTGRRYVEVKAEDLAADWAGRRAALFSGLGLPDFATPSAFSASSLDRRRIDPGVRAEIEDGLGDLVPAMGYA